MKNEKKKKGTTRKSKYVRRGKVSTEKGRLLEQIAARMYRSQLHDVIPNAKLPPINRNPKLTREIDVLLQSRVVTRPARRAIECKNLNEKVGVEKIDAFVGKLEDLGISHEHGIYISPSGYTEDAIDRSRPVNLQLLTLTGLTEDGLASITADASQLRVFYLAQVQGLTITNALEKIENAAELLIFFDRNGNFCGTVADLIWNQWREEMVPAEAGEHNIELVVPAGWRQIINGKEEAILSIEAALKVTALVLKIPGESTYYTLIRASDGVVEKRQLNATFNVTFDQTTVQKLEAFDSEEELTSALQDNKGVRVTIRTKLPRIQYMNRFYYPLSVRVQQLLKSRWEDSNEPDVSADDLDINDIEGTDLRAMFEPISDEYPGKLVPVIIYDKEGRSSVDVSALVREGQYQRASEFESHFHGFPRPELGVLLHDANLLYAEKLLEGSAGRSRKQTLRLAYRAKEKVINALRFNPLSAEAHHDLGFVLQEMGRHSQAVISFDLALKLAPVKISTLNLKAQSLKRLNRFADALEAYDRVLSLQPGNIEALFYRSGLLGALGRYNESIESYDSVLRITPKHYEALYCRGLGQFKSELYVDAADSFTQALRVRPREADALIYRGMAFERSGRNEEALSDYNMVISSDANKHELLINRGSVLKALGRYEEALKDLDEGLKHDDENSTAWNIRGATLDHLGRFNDALESYEKAIERDPNDRIALTNRGITLSRVGRQEDALVSFDDALKIEPTNIPTLHSKGLALYRLGRFNEALTAYDQVLALNNNAHDTIANKALTVAELGRMNDALDGANRALSLAPHTTDRAMLLLIRAKVSYLMSRLEDAAVDIMAAWRVDPDLVIGLQECHSIFIEYFEASDTPSVEQSQLYAQISGDETETLAIAVSGDSE